MAVNDFSVAKALLDQLNTIETASLQVVPQGASYEPDGTENYLRESVLPARSIVQDYKTGTRQNGIYQVDVCTPKANGKWSNLAIVAAIKGAFTQTDVLSHNGQDVKIMSISTAGLVDDDNAYWFTPVSVEFVAFG